MIITAHSVTGQFVMPELEWSPISDICYVYHEPIDKCSLQYHEILEGNDPIDKLFKQL